MKRIFIVLLSLSATAFASNPQVEVSNFNFEYEDPIGHGTADGFSAQGLREDGVTVDVEKKADNFYLKVQGAANGEYVLKKAPEFLTKAKTISLTAFELSFKEALNLTLDEGSFDSPKEGLLLQNFVLNCSRNASEAEVLDQIVSGCTQQLVLKSSKFNSSSLIGGFVSSLVAGMTGAKGTSVTINSLDLKVSGGKFNLNAEVKAQVSGKAKSYGEMKYDSTSNVLTVKINEVKFSVLNVTNQVFDELKKNESATMKVSKPYVYLTLK